MAAARLSFADWLWLATLLVIGAWAIRGMAWWPLGAALVVAAALPGERPRTRPRCPSAPTGSTSPWSA